MSFSQIAMAADGLGARRRRNAGIPGLEVLLDLARRLGEHRQRQRDYRYLLAQPDSLLADIGVPRSQIVAAMRGRPF